MDRRILLIAGTVLGLGLAFLGFQWFGTNSAFHGTTFDPPEPAENFTLQTADGPIQLSDFRDKVVLLYFGYTFCPDACPTTLAKVSRAFQTLGDASKDIRMIMISVDPERDTPELLAQYVHNFNPEFIGATASVEEIDVLTKKYGIFYEKKRVNSAALYLIDHTTILQGIDQQGNKRIVWPHDAEVADLVADLKMLLRGR